MMPEAAGQLSFSISAISRPPGCGRSAAWHNPQMVSVRLPLGKSLVWVLHLRDLWAPATSSVYWPAVGGSGVLSPEADTIIIPMMTSISLLPCFRRRLRDKMAMPPWEREFWQPAGVGQNPTYP